MKGTIFLVVNLVLSSVFCVEKIGCEWRYILEHYNLRTKQTLKLCVFAQSAAKKSCSKLEIELHLTDIGEDKDISEINKGDDILTVPQSAQRSAINDEDALWTSPIPYVLDGSLEMNAKGVILKAFDQFRLKTCIDFKPRDSEENYISFQKLNGCFSYVGKAVLNGQPLSIGTFCDFNSIVEHEILHALGFFHEQSRYDRDDFVTIVLDNIIEGMEFNFDKVPRNLSTTNGVPYDFMSVMHYGKDAFTNGNGSTIITKDPKYQDIIGQRLEMSHSDVLELNRLYKCNSSIAFKMQCSFSDETMCQMNHCSEGGTGWEMVTRVDGGPSSDHTNLPSGSNEMPNGVGYFMHASTVSGTEGELSLLETKRMSTTRDCNVQCLQFYYYQSGNQSDQLNIWMRHFQDEWDQAGTRFLIGQITGQQTSHWQIQHVSLNATKHFQVEFEVRKGAGQSSGGFSIDDINLSEIECPHVALQVDDFERVLNTSGLYTVIPTTRQYSSGGYAYRFGIMLFKSFFGVYVQLFSGKNDDQLQWPCPQRQVTFTMLDQNSNIQLQMSKQRSITTDLQTFNNGTFLWDNPREIGTPFTDENNETHYAGPAIGIFLGSANELKTMEFLKGGSIVLVFSFQDLTPLVTGNVLPCPKLGPAKIANPPTDQDKGSCSSRISTTLPPAKTTDGSIFGFCPGLVASPILIFLLASMLLIN